MSGWARIKLVASVVWWGIFAGLCVMGYNSGAATSTFWEGLAFFGIVYALAAAVWWAFAGFSRNP